MTLRLSDLPPGSLRDQAIRNLDLARQRIGMWLQEDDA